MEIINTIVPIFMVIALGVIAKKRGMIPESFQKPANRITFYLAIPALIFRAIAKSDFRAQFDTYLLIGTLLPIVIGFGIVWIILLFSGVQNKQKGTLIDTAIHGNIGYIGLAVVFYYLGNDALAIAGILAGFIMLTQNLLGVIALVVYSKSTKPGNGWLDIFKKTFHNPVIMTAGFSILFSLSTLEIPIIIDRTLRIIGNLALPLALLLIGASLSFRIQMKKWLMVGLVCLVKLVIIPGVGIWLYLHFGVAKELFIPGLILLGMPVATVSYILATELKGDPELAVSTISISTALSGFTILVWLSYTSQI